MRPTPAWETDIRSVDKHRVRRVFGKVSPSELAGIDEGLELFLGLHTA